MMMMMMMMMMYGYQTGHKSGTHYLRREAHTAVCISDWLDANIL
jgi:hypothetical protein